MNTNFEHLGIALSRAEAKKIMGGDDPAGGFGSCPGECPEAGSSTGCPSGKTCKEQPCGNNGQKELQCVNP